MSTRSLLPANEGQVLPFRPSGDEQASTGSRSRLKSPSPRVLYYRKAPQEAYLVFAPPERALFIDQIHRAIEESKTWGEFRRRLPAGEYEKLYADQFSSDAEDIEEDDSLREPEDSEGFGNNVPGYSEGDYPPWIALEQGRYLPHEILEEFATRADTFVNGSFWRIDAARAASIVNKLESLGYKVEE